MKRDNLPFGRKIKLQAPATIANVVCAFDIMGMCLDGPADEMEIQLLDSNEIILESNGTYPLPAEPALNTAGAPLLGIQKALPFPVGFRVKIDKHIKPGSGLGSSAASAAGAVAGANYLLGNYFSEHEMVRFAMLGEEAASGVQHPDNVVPCLLGGITLIRETHPLDIISLPHLALFISIVHPQIEVKTSDARAILKHTVPLPTAIRQWANVGGLIAGIYSKDYDLIGRSLKDSIVEPLRSMLVPGFDEVKKAGRDSGALGGGISGSGPTLFMLSREKQTAVSIAASMKTIFDGLGIENHTYISAIGRQGVRITG